jgi:hypothetical protein
VGNPGDPQIVSQVSATGLVHDVAVSGDFAYVTVLVDAYTSDFQIINISDPENPRIVANMDTEKVGLSVQISGDYAYLAAGSGGLKIIDISDPPSLQIVGTLEHPVSRVVVENNQAFVSSYHGGDAPNWLDVIDITDHERPFLVGGLETIHNARGCSISGDLAFLATADLNATISVGSMLVIDIANPEELELIGQIDTSGKSNGVAVSGGFAFVAEDWDGLSVYDVSNPENAPQIGGVNTPGRASGLAVSGTLAYVADDVAGLLVFDTVDPEDPQLLASLETPGLAQMIVVSENIAFLAERWPGALNVIDISNPHTPHLICTEPLPENPYSMAINGDYLYLAIASRSLLVVDISDPEFPLVVGSVSPEPGVDSLAFHEQYIYAIGNGGMLVLDVSQPEAPQMVAFLELPHHCRGITVSDDHAYISNYELGLLVADVTSPLDPLLVGTTDAEFSAYNAKISGDFAYVSGRQTHVVNIENPQMPKLVGCTGHYSSSVEVSSEHIITASSLLNTSGLRILPPQCGSTTPVFLLHFFVKQEVGLVSATWQLAEPSDSAEFKLLANNGTTEWEIEHLEISPGEFMAQDDSPLQIPGDRIDFTLQMRSSPGQWMILGQTSITVEDPPSLSRLFPPFPNPLNPSTTISFECQQQGPLELAIFDLSGKRVITLVDQWREAGLHEITWNGRNTAGHPVAAGQYMVRMETGEIVDTQKIILAK